MTPFAAVYVGQMTSFCFFSHNRSENQLRPRGYCTTHCVFMYLLQCLHFVSTCHSLLIVNLSKTSARANTLNHATPEIYAHHLFCWSSSDSGLDQTWRVPTHTFWRLLWFWFSALTPHREKYSQCNEQSDIWTELLLIEGLESECNKQWVSGWVSGGVGWPGLSGKNFFPMKMTFQKLSTFPTSLPWPTKDRQHDLIRTEIVGKTRSHAHDIWERRNCSGVSLAIVTGISKDRFLLLGKCFCSYKYKCFSKYKLRQRRTIDAFCHLVDTYTYSVWYKSLRTINWLLMKHCLGLFG